MTNAFPKAFCFCLFISNLFSVLSFQSSFEICFLIFNTISVLFTLCFVEKLSRFESPTLASIYILTTLPYLFLSDTSIAIWWRLIWLCIHIINFQLLQSLTSDKKIPLIFAFSPFILFETVGLGNAEEFLILSVLLLIIALKKQSKLLYSLSLTISVFFSFWTLPLLIFLVKKIFILPLLIFCTFTGVYFLTYKTPSIYFISDIAYFDNTINIILFVIIIRALYLFFLGGSLQNQIKGFYHWCLFLIPIIEPNMVILPIVCALSLGNTHKFILLSCTAMGLHFIDFDSNSNQNYIYSALFFISLLLPEIYIRRFVFNKKGPWINKISIVTPVYNEEKNISELSKNLLQEKHLIDEWIIVDAGSNDSSETLSKKAGATFLNSPKKGRGEQIRFGVENARSDWVLILHADTRLSSNALGTLQKMIYQYHGVVGGAFKMCYRNYAHLGPLFILNDLKTRLFKISFGDQSQFIKIKTDTKEVPFPALALMEDVEVSMSWLGKPSLFIDSARSSTSSRRWKEKGRMNNSLLIIKLLFQYFLNRQLYDKVNVKNLYNRYYNKNA